MGNANNIDFTAGEEMSFLNTSPPPIQDSTQDVMNSPDVYNMRLNTCMSCQYVTEDRTCSECNCPVVMMAQMNFKTCPKEFW